MAESSQTSKSATTNWAQTTPSHGYVPTVTATMARWPPGAQIPNARMVMRWVNGPAKSDPPSTSNPRQLAGAPISPSRTPCCS